ncbi:hypothetical protein HY768_10420 [candidate division TA06 bacterium]|uniref:Outer membrane protein beta-barrel domain-containing protein n=1 Tax=candidate division TA06 bacterium TaxID=2250710 RepID=A0A933MLK8_UNCT6|nr:hypothetical protein [candidate division TA06 bacterium]
MKKTIFLLALLLITLYWSSFAVGAEHSLVTDFTRYKNESAGLNGLGFTYKLIVRDSANHKLGMQFFYSRLPYQYSGTPAVSRDRYSLYSVSLLRPFTPYSEILDLEITPALGLTVHTTWHDILIEDPLVQLNGWHTGDGSGVSYTYVSPSLGMDIKRFFYKNKLGAGFGVHLRYFVPVFDESGTIDK